MKILAVVDVHPLGEGRGRGLFARISKGGTRTFDLPISREQAGILLSNVESLIDRDIAAPQTPEEENLFSEFAANVQMAVGDDSSYDSPQIVDDEDDL